MTPDAKTEPSPALGSEISGTGLDVGFLCHGWWPDPGGVESHTRDLARELATRGHRVHVLCLDGREGRDPYTITTSDEDGVEVRRMAYRYHDHAALADLVRNPRAEDVVLAWLAETPCDVIHVHHLTGFGSGALRAIADIGAPLVMTLHDYWSLCPRGQMLHVDGEVCEAPDAERCAGCIARTWPHLLPSQDARAEGPDGEPLADDLAAAAKRTDFALECLGRAQRLYTPSEAARAVYVRAGVASERIVVVENGIDVGGLAARVAELRGARPEGGPVRLGLLGSVLPSKGALELVRAFRAAEAPGLVLDVHGGLYPYHGDSTYLDELRRVADEDQRVVLHGEYPLESLPAILAGLDGVVAPSRWEEVYGLTVREARAAGLPVLVSDAGDLPSVTAAGTAGLVVPRDDHDAWVRALERFARDEEARAQWGAAQTPLRTAADMMLELERSYVDVIVEVTGQRPDVGHEEEQATASEPTPARRGLLGRLFGRRQ